MKTHAGWSIGDGPDGERIWTSPTGHQYAKQSEQRWAAPNESPPPQKPLPPSGDSSGDSSGDNSDNSSGDSPDVSSTDSSNDEPPF